MSEHDDIMARFERLEAAVDQSEIRIMTALGFELTPCRDSFHNKPWKDRQYGACDQCKQNRRGNMYKKVETSKFPVDIARVS